MRTKFTLLLSFIAILGTFSACQKELSPNDPLPIGNTTGTAKFNLVGAPGVCTSPVINGVYQQGTASDTSNYVTLQVNVDSVGTYSIVSSSVNGITFASAGTFIATGLQTIALSAAGTPGSEGSFNFTPGSNGCSFSVSFSAGTQPPVANVGCKDCIYIPICVGSKYEYVDTIFDPLSGTKTLSVRRADYLSSVDTTIDGRIYKKVEISNGTTNNPPSYLNCLNGETTNIAYNVQSTTSGNVLVAIKSIELKADAAVGTSWTDSAAYASGSTLYRKHTITQKGITRTVSGVNFNDVIVVSVEQSVFYVDPPVGLLSAGVTQYYLAKGIGIIETITTGENPIDNTTYISVHSVLKTYFIPN